jgi:transcriptional repressor NrdR
MRCPKCHADDTKVIDSREATDGLAIRRRRSCPTCTHRFTTYERMEEVPLMVVKGHGGREPFERGKIIAGVTAASKESISFHPNRHGGLSLHAPTRR